MLHTRVLSRASVAHPTAAGTRALEELTVYLRAMKSAQRRWAREILAHESHVRRLMLFEEQCRDKLEQQVLRGTREHLKYLTNTDLMTVSQLVSPPSTELFLAYDIPAEQISGFSVYVMGCVAADASRLNIPLPVLLADLSSAWAILPPTKKDAFHELAHVLRTNVLRRAPPMATTPRKSSSSTASKPTRRRVRTPVTRTTRKPKATTSCASSKETRAAASDADVVVSARQRLRTRDGGHGSAATVQPSLMEGRASPRSSVVVADAGAAAAETSDVSRDLFPSHRQQLHQQQQQPHHLEHQQQCSRRRLPAKHVVEMETAAMEAFARQLPPDEYDAFYNFAEASLREMELALGASIVPAAKTPGSSRKVGGIPRGVRLFMKEWLPIAAEEWLRKTRRQKSLYWTRRSGVD